MILVWFTYEDPITFESGSDVIGCYNAGDFESELFDRDIEVYKITKFELSDPSIKEFTLLSFADCMGTDTAEVEINNSMGTT